MQRVARVRPLAPADPALTPGRGGGAAATALHIQAEREKLHQLGNRAPHARAVTACGLEECPYCALPTATPADGDGDGLLPPRKKKRIELPTAPCTGFGPAARCGPKTASLPHAPSMPRSSERTVSDPRKRHHQPIMMIVVVMIID